MTWENIIKLIHDLLLDEGKHFFFSSLAGGSVSCLIWIICSVSLLAWERLTRRKTSMVAVYCTLGLVLLVGLSFALLSHSWLDGLSSWYVTPLGPPLKLDLGGGGM